MCLVYGLRGVCLMIVRNLTWHDSMTPHLDGGRKSWYIIICVPHLCTWYWNLCIQCCTYLTHLVSLPVNCSLIGDRFPYQLRARAPWGQPIASRPSNFSHRRVYQEQAPRPLSLSPKRYTWRHHGLATTQAIQVYLAYQHWLYVSHVN